MVNFIILVLLYASNTQVNDAGNALASIQFSNLFCPARVKQKRLVRCNMIKAVTYFLWSGMDICVCGYVDVTQSFSVHAKDRSIEKLQMSLMKTSEEHLCLSHRLHLQPDEQDFDRVLFFTELFVSRLLLAADLSGNSGTPEPACMPAWVNTTRK